ncbi:ABC transporter permease [Gelidibacter salicanalis]|uniref:ABC transporter permease n=1 Tax=Gelidibacter salicanalis TaxID=291193 RepID=A0A934KTF6_9FLAO|nr:ABC transporter permease [Gelidibacter salicanalis]MBJ7879848.1 ABC transporter permease [Gelidibacter salicanalis]
MIRNYFKIAFRNLWRHRGFSALNISGLAIGMAAGFLILLYVGFELSYDKTHSRGDSIYRVVADIKTPSEKIEANMAAWPVAPNLQQEFPEIIAATRFLTAELPVQLGNIKFVEPRVAAVDSTFFKIFDFELLKGNPDKVLNRPNSLVLSERTAKKYFGEEDPIGKTLKIQEDGVAAEVTGIMKNIPENSHIQADLLLSMITLTQPPNNYDAEWGNYGPSVYVLTATGTSPEALQAKFSDFLERRTGDRMRNQKMFVTLLLEPFQEVYLRSERGGDITGSINNVYIFSIIGLFILLIASINFINLSTARSVERAKEVGIRKVVGAGKNQLALQFIGESVILCLIAFVLATVLTAIALPYFNTLAGKTVSAGVFSNQGNIGYLFLISVSIGVLAGIYPAIVLSSFKPKTVLKGRFSTGNKGGFLRKGLVVAQFSISIALIIGTIIIYNQMQFMHNQDLGFSKEQTLVLQSNIDDSQKALTEAFAALPGVKSIALGSSVPGAGNSAAYSEIENKNGDLQVANLDLYFVNEDYIPEFGLKMVAGRPFSRDFATDSTQAMVVNEKTVQLLGYAKPQDAIGARFKQWGREGQIIGVVKNFHFRTLQQEIKPLTMRLDPRETSLIAIKISPQDISKTVSAIKETWQSFVPAEPFDYDFLDEFFDRQYRAEERFGNLFLNFAALAIFISCLGLLGLAAYSTIQRRREIGIRKIIGASVPGIVNLLSKEFIILVGIAFLIASPIAWYGMHKWLQDFAYRIDIEWWVFALAGVSALGIALVTVSFQAIKAALANPVKSLRTE